MFNKTDFGCKMLEFNGKCLIKLQKHLEKLTKKTAKIGVYKTQHGAKMLEIIRGYRSGGN